ncbi:hypothetical protein BDV23DRAFT_115888 [Aspergillus alliaceus]|uniref:Uncharacterized protein n=1 Tax=Petromyces alliaceus TaxID=209559 RepID=A0A5N7CN90_PETAA|nr:hypothetical protein BDV23DRAFT_115888 [Aspergillus alliaceus]
MSLYTTSTQSISVWQRIHLGRLWQALSCSFPSCVCLCILVLLRPTALGCSILVRNIYNTSHTCRINIQTLSAITNHQTLYISGDDIYSFLPNGTLISYAREFPFVLNI